MKTIIVPTDFSNSSFNAAFYAAAMAMDIDADLILLHLLPSPFVVSEIPLPPESYTGTMEESNRSLRILEERLQKFSNNKLSISTLATDINFLDQMADYARTKEIFAVIVGATGMGATDIFFWGSFTIEAVKNLLCPIIVVPAQCKYKLVEKIGLACDMINVRNSLPIKEMQTILEIFKAELDVLFVNRTSERIQPELLSESKFVQNTLARYRPIIRILTYGNVKEGLEEFVLENRIDLLLLLPRKRNFLDRIFHKSITRKIILRPSVPVMVVH